MKAILPDRLSQVGHAATIASSEKARLMALDGIDVVDFGGSSPNYVTPTHIIDAAIQALRDGFTSIVNCQGIKELRDAIADKMKHDDGLSCDPDTEIIVTPGSKFGIYAAIQALTAPGDEVILPEPAWLSFRPGIYMAGAVPVSITLSPEEGYRVTAEKLRKVLSPKTRMFISNTPHNPTGRVYTLEELKVIADFVKENDLICLADEAYEKVVYDGHKHISIATLPGMAERTVTTRTFTKTYAMGGWRLGWNAGNSKLIDRILRVQEHAMSFATSFVQRAGVAALTGPQDYLVQWMADMDARRKLLAQGLNRLLGVSCHMPEGGYEVFPDISGTGMSSREFTDFLMEKARVAATPGTDYGPPGEGYVRMAFSRSPLDRVQLALESMEKALGK